MRGLRIIGGSFSYAIIEFNTPQLHTFEFEGDSLEDLIYLIVPPLERCQLLLYSRRIVKFYSLLLPVLPDLQTLSLGWHNYHDIPKMIPEFSSLKLLEFFPLHHSNYNFFSIKRLLDVCPMLEKLHFDIKLKPSTDTYTRHLVLSSERVKYVNLQEIIIGGFSGTEKEIEFVKYLLETAINLKKIAISYSYREFYDGKWTNVDDRQIKPQMLEKKQLLHDSLSKEMASHDATLIIC